MLVVAQLARLLAYAVLVAPAELPPRLALANGAAAVLSSSSIVSPSELIAIARRESRFDPLAGPRRDWPVRAEDFPRRRHLACGVCQTIVRTPRACVALRPVMAGYRAAADELSQWTTTCARMGRRGARRRRCARLGYRRGVAAARRAS